jgi:radical SAM protein with 4Fe4S-binding SPASM domain
MTMQTDTSAEPSSLERGRRCAFPWQLMVIDLTGEVLPCPYFHFAGSGRTLGNTNLNSLEEIWNGPGYQTLRERHVSGDLEGHPCKNCMAYRTMGGQYPAFEWGDSFRGEQGLCYIAQIPERFWERNRDRTDQIILLEDGVSLPYPQSLHRDIRRYGQGRYSVWRGFIYMATVDGSNPACNGRRYELRCGDDAAVIASLDLTSASAHNLVAGYDEYRNGATTLSARPSKITFIETSDCNIDCPACSQNEVRLMRVQHRPETNPDVLSHVPFLQELIWHGGEPYMMPRFRRFVEEFHRDQNPNFSFGFMSNGTMISASEAKKLENFQRFNVTISVDSFIKTTYDRMRSGAKYEQVMDNLFRLLAMQDWPTRKVVVAMIIGKSNILDLSYNIRFALQHNIRLMVNPITQYPPTEKLTLFANFSAQTEGWAAVLAEAEYLLEEAKRLDRLSLLNLDPTGTVREIKTLYEQQRAEHADVVELEVEVDDPHGSIARMRCPGLMVCEGAGGPYEAVAYAEIASGAGAHRLRIPKTRFTRPMRYALYADLFETGSEWHPLDRVIDPAEGARLHRVIKVPQYERPPRPKNIHYMKFGPDNGLRLEERIAMFHAYVALAEKERAAGWGFIEDAAVGEEKPAAGLDSGDPTGGRAAQARTSWRRFLINYFRPFAPKGYAERS